ncbi:hypothetical protein D3C76_1200310 [compost metagenome]
MASPTPFNAVTDTWDNSGMATSYALAGGLATEHRRMESARISIALGRGKLARQAIATVRNGAGGLNGRTSITPGA